jgi:ribosomal protein S18 acetylase RimI-like enzyme
LAASEQATVARGRETLRLEVHEKNHRAISRYRKAGYRQFGCHAAYYADAGDALRFEKPLTTARTHRKRG